MSLPTISVVVTGAAGFIGSRLLAHFSNQRGAGRVLAVDHPVTAAKSPNLAVSPQSPFLDHQAFLAALESGTLVPDLILHMGACSSTTETSWEYLADNNLAYSQKLWRWSAAHGKKLIYASSAATYGDGGEGFDDERDIRQLKPLNLYGRSKHEFDVWVEDQILAGVPQPVQSVGLKFFNVFGPGEAHKGRMASMVFHGFHQIRQQGTVKLFKSHRPGFTDGGQLRDFIYVNDLVRVIAALADRPSVSGLFNLGTGKARSFRELIEAVYLALGLPPQIEYVPMPEDLQGRYQYFTEATMKKLAKAGVPYVPTVLEEAVADYVGQMVHENP
ncbi:MAG TPA: ADP-glyceromanno-heptose 6-epimerase [Candidatus Limnocylindria bacterium]|jgi:ADP-L-glycero-D-manno-heptose 6-epimerase|nr:ADP-glyceromanno-heptose 6-epimerase [Candidatus Limnocylindria bacterium]